MKKEIVEIQSEDLTKLVRATKEIVELHIKYFKLGVEVPDIAVTFARLYQTEFGSAIDNEAIEKFNRKLKSERLNGDTTDVSRKEFTNHACIQLSTALLKAICNGLKDDK